MVTDEINDFPSPLLKMDGFDDCILGICERHGMDTVIAYDKNKVIAKLVSQGMTEEEAHEFFEYNQIGAWMGELTPVFVTIITAKENQPCPKTSKPAKK